MIKFQDLQLFNSQFEDEFMRVCQQLRPITKLFIVIRRPTTFITLTV